MNIDELKEYLKENLTIDIDQEVGYDGVKHTEISLMLDGEKISTEYLDLDFGDSW
jgi:hypothetical protein